MFKRLVNVSEFRQIYTARIHQYQPANNFARYADLQKSIPIDLTNLLPLQGQLPVDYALKALREHKQPFDTAGYLFYWTTGDTKHVCFICKNHALSTSMYSIYFFKIIKDTAIASQKRIQMLFKDNKIILLTKNLQKHAEERAYFLFAMQGFNYMLTAAETKIGTPNRIVDNKPSTNRFGNGTSVVIVRNKTWERTYSLKNPRKGMRLHWRKGYFHHVKNHPELPMVWQSGQWIGDAKKGRITHTAYVMK